VVILTAGYILWAIQRVYLGPEYKGPHPEALTPMTKRELSIAAPLMFFAILFGVYPNCVLRYMQPSVDRQVDQLAAWTQAYDERSTVAKPLDEEDGRVAVRDR
jgi:NADH-quinone oxidoreductase subunit M